MIFSIVRLKQLPKKTTKKTGGDNTRFDIHGLQGPDCYRSSDRPQPEPVLGCNLTAGRSKPLWMKIATGLKHC